MVGPRGRSPPSPVPQPLPHAAVFGPTQTAVPLTAAAPPFVRAPPAPPLAAIAACWRRHRHASTHAAGRSTTAQHHLIPSFRGNCHPGPCAAARPCMGVASETCAPPSEQPTLHEPTTITVARRLLPRAFLSGQQGGRTGSASLGQGPDLPITGALRHVPPCLRCSPRAAEHVMRPAPFSCSLWTLRRAPARLLTAHHRHPGATQAPPRHHPGTTRVPARRRPLRPKQPRVGESPAGCGGAQLLPCCPYDYYKADTPTRDLPCLGPAPQRAAGRRDVHRRCARQAGCSGLHGSDQRKG